MPCSFIAAMELRMKNPDTAAPWPLTGRLGEVCKSAPTVSEARGRLHSRTPEGIARQRLGDLSGNSLLGHEALEYVIGVSGYWESPWCRCLALRGGRRFGHLYGTVFLSPDVAPFNSYETRGVADPSRTLKSFRCLNQTICRPPAITLVKT